MERSFAEELYSDSLQLLKAKEDPVSTGNASEDDVWGEGGSFCDDLEDMLDHLSDLDREWQRRHDKLFNLGYRDGLFAGKEASSQEGFNIGYKHSVPVGYSWGLVRGVTSALAVLPDGLKERLVEAPEKRGRYQNLFESIHSLSTSDALKLFSDEILSGEKTQHSGESRATDQVGPPQQSSETGRIGAYVGQLKEMLDETPAVDVHLDVSASSTA